MIRPFRLWQFRDRARIARVFRPNEYLALNPDVAEHGVEPLGHYLADGWREGRRPLRSFDPQFYVEAHMGGRLSEPPLLHYAREGAARGLPTAANASPGGGMTGSASADGTAGDGLLPRLFGTAADKRLAAALRRAGFPGRADPKLLHMVAAMFDADAYRDAAGLEPGMSHEDAFAHWLEHGLTEGMPPGPLFDAAFYADAAGAAGLPTLDAAGDAFVHWLRHGVPARIAPTPLFDEAAYLAHAPELGRYPDWLFEHFVLHGLAEGRRFHRVVMAYGGDEAQRARWTRDLVRLMHAKPDAAAALDAMRDHRTSDLFHEQVAQACALDPNVGMDDPFFSLLPPWHDGLYRLYARMRAAIPEGAYDAVVLMPFCKMGGADFVAGTLATALEAAGRRVLVLRTDQPDWERPDWFPEGVATADLSPFLDWMPASHDARALFHLLREIGARDVFNVNSRRTFEMLRPMGRRLADACRVHCYYFCADRTPEGVEVGYPVWFFADILPALTTALVDSESLAATLVERHALPPDLAARVVPLPSASLVPPRAAPVAERQVETAAARTRPRVLWAGRLDRQKRFDIVIDVARAMPDVDFLCWGKAVLDQAPDLSDLPPNVAMQGTFASFDELPVEACDGYLYTSDWDGIPTMVIELGAMGMPMVASAAGGVPEVVDDETGWSVPAGAAPEAYVSALRAMLADPEARVARARALRDRVARRHAPAAYAEGVAARLDAPAAPGTVRAAPPDPPVPVVSPDGPAPDVSLVVTAHREGPLAGVTARSARAAVEHAARERGIACEVIVVLDRADATTRGVLAHALPGAMVIETDTGDPGMARNAGVAAARGGHVAFLDGDDLWSENWLSEAWRLSRAEPGAALHSQCNLTFGGERNLWWHVDSRTALFDPGYLPYANYWDAMSFAPAALLRDHPFRPNDLSAGYGHEDWHWNVRTLAAGVAHVPVPGTMHFKRRRAGSQMTRAEAAVIWPD